MKSLTFSLITACLLAACGAEGDEDTSTTSTSADAARAAERLCSGAPAGPHYWFQSEYEEGAETFDFEAVGVDLDDLDGRRVVFALGHLSDPELRVLAVTDIRRGTFHARVPDGLVSDLHYPRFVTFIDADGDGACSRAELRNVQLYAVIGDVGACVRPADLQIAGDDFGNPETDCAAIDAALE